MTITTEELTEMREDYEATILVSTCNILSTTPTVGADGSRTHSWGTATAGAKCYLENVSQLSGREEMKFGAAIRPYTTWRLYLEHDVVLAAENRVEHGSDTFNVIDNNADPDLQIATVAILEKIS